jgi:uncharacterized protein
MRRLFKISALAISCILCCWIALFIVGRQLCAPEESKVPVPSQLPIEDIKIISKSGTILNGWRINGVYGKGVVILLHSLRSNRSSMINRAGFLWKNGYTILMCDFQAHGESKGKKITFGYLEALDVQAILNYAKANFSQERIGVIGVSLGGAAILLRKEATPLDAVVLEAVYPTIEDATRDRINIRLGPIANILTPLLLTQLKVQIGITRDALKPIDHIGRLHSPLLLIAGTLDKHTTISESKEIYAKANEPKEFWEISDAKHEDFYNKKPEEYENKILSFFNKYLRVSGKRM